MSQISKRDNTNAGICGLNNLGNTCFMNSGIQCLSNTEELTKYFISDLYKKDVNTANKFGFGGKFAGAWADLLREMWVDNSKSTSPYDFKRLLGSRIGRFAGYGQQDSSELLNKVLELLHEEVNQGPRKAYVEIPDDDMKTPDSERAALFWSGFTNTNRSLFVDLMYGQQK